MKRPQTNIILLLTALILNILVLSECHSLPISVESTSVETEVALAYQNTQPNDTIIQLRVSPEIELSLGGQMSLIMSGRFHLDPADDLSPGQLDLESYSSQSRPLNLGDQGIAELRDFYVEFGSDLLNWRIGKQQIVWGELDGFKNLDAVNPQSFREFILDDFESSRIGLWSVNANFKLNAWNGQIFWAPDPTVHDIPVRGATFALSAPRFTFNARELGFSETQINYPSNTLGNASYGVRLNTLTDSNIDFSLSYQSGLDHTSVGRSVDVQDGRLLIQEFERREIFGLSASKAFSKFVVRAELGYRPKKTFSVISQTSLFTERLDQVTAAVGIDINGPGKWFTNIQYLYDKVERTDFTLVRPREDRIVTFYARRAWQNETLFFDIKWYSTDSFSDGLIRPEFRYLINDSISASVGVDVFYGSPDGIFGQFDKKDRIVFKVQHVF